MGLFFINLVRVEVSLKLTIGMPSYKNFEEVFFTVQSLRLHHDLKDTEIVVVDNFGDTHLEKFARGSGVRYEKFIDTTGVSAAKIKFLKSPEVSMFYAWIPTFC
jgi:hypothetical protein